MWSLRRLLCGSARLGEALAHLGEQRLECGTRANHDRQVADQAGAVEADQVQTLKITVPHASIEDERSGAVFGF